MIRRAPSSSYIALAALLLLLTANHAAAEQAPASYSMPLTEVHVLSSTALDGDVHLQVGLPFGYNSGTQSYPLVVVLDGDVMFGLTTETLRLMSFEGTPSAVTVGISYGDLNRWIQNRVRDYHPSDEQDAGAARFLAMLTEEALPLLQQQYRIDPEATILYGHSSGGIFSLYAAHQVDTPFEYILASSPSVEKEPEWTDSIVRSLNNDSSNIPQLFIAAGGTESGTLPALEKYVKALREARPNGNVSYQVFEGQTHMGVIPSAFVTGIRKLLQIKSPDK